MSRKIIDLGNTVVRVVTQQHSVRLEFLRGSNTDDGCYVPAKSFAIYLDTAQAQTLADEIRKAAE